MNDTPERWLPIPGYEGRYDVSDQGRVRSWLPHNGTPVPRVLTSSPNPGGYLSVRLCKAGRISTKDVHPLILLAFVGPPPDGLETRHLDGDQINNVLTNLRYGTKSENAQDMIRHGTHAMTNRERCPAGHEYTEANIYINPSSGGRVCRECKRAEVRAWRARKRAEKLMKAEAA